MSIRPYREIIRRKSRQIYVGNVPVGGDAPISVQSMTNTLTSDPKATIEQILALEEAGADMVRVSCPDDASTKALKEIVRETNVPIIADIHFHYKRGIEAAEAGAACLRINPGNIGSADRVRDVVKAAVDHNCSMRIGVNAGSLERELLEKYGEPCPDAMVESALNHARILEDNDFFNFKISVKASDVFLSVAAYQGLAEACDYPLHLGITEAGGLSSGTVKSSIGLGMLLWSGIGDTLRVSLSADPVEEVKVGYEILKSLGLRRRGVTIISCPSCARQAFPVIKTVETLEKRLAHIQTPLTLSIIGCVVNGPGEARETDIGLTGGGKDNHMVYLSGVTDHRIDTGNMVDHIVELVEAKAAEIEALNAADEEGSGAPHLNQAGKRIA
ncbi:MAG: 4-hydroxy-3-methylbut-2-en-1-yl diphosphate synthase [Sneathiella sp.]|jgi:(E)-4-hydroxy-3-methylbut-2-enyl-diphosphate synthase|uniref:flavodoxin-dependent (E)-4-hydroxy-3-methylbut-2-enyl-diphosphate synthase n=1 Tax=Sneathiella sp. TaxID=1964365 RepID=UPI000C63809F|nr:flavodoxin-dependent (E)-4-hydroxy-3-methylbut-2-enyl-diphosphate synthase [Sneathiella sp.]MAL78432.1 4-hydroxy-3-methylbut-2-en-1-yl diphosphate synthase [Sneathiella sp.]